MRVYYRPSSLIGQIRTSFLTPKRNKIGNQNFETRIGNSPKKKFNFDKSKIKYQEPLSQ